MNSVLLSRNRYNEEKDFHTRSVGFGIKDSYKREVGAHIMTYEITLSPVPAGWQGTQFRLAPGRYFVFRKHATRDGKTYDGASQDEKYFKTVAARQAAINKYLADAIKRAGKK